MEIPFWVWAAVLGFILLMLAVDLFAHRHAHVIGVREAAVWSGVWVAFGIGFGALVWWGWGAEFGQQYFAGYLIEKSLAVDNVFVWAIVFSCFAVPRRFQHRVLFLGVLGALVLRFVYLKAGLALVLIWVGIKMLLTIDLFHISTSISLAVVATILTVSVLTSLRATRGRGRQALPAPPVPPFRTAPAAEIDALELLWGRNCPTVRRGAGKADEDAIGLHEGGAPARRGAGDRIRTGAHDDHDRHHEGEPR